MLFRFLALTAVLGFMTQAPQPLAAQPANSSAAPSQAQTSAVPQSPAARPDCNGVPCEEQQPHVIVTLPQPAPAPWLLHDRIELGAKLALALLGYVGVLLAVSTLKKIERHTAAAEATAQAALEAAQAALKNAQSVAHAERPWLLITVEPSREKLNSFIVTATNRGRTPASIVTAAGEIQFAVDESSLQAVPEYKSADGAAPQVPVILVPGESVPIKSFGRDDVQALCGTEERFKRIEAWSEKIFIYGKIVYRDLIAPPDEQMHTTNWCCWYIHGRQKSGMVIAGPAAYNSHT